MLQLWYCLFVKCSTDVTTLLSFLNKNYDISLRILKVLSFLDSPLTVSASALQFTSIFYDVIGT
jgi:hypothetical protein